LARSGNYAEAAKHFQAALEADPKNAVAQKGLAQLPASTGRADP
jgi:Flp pilus assembly protein TadD